MADLDDGETHEMQGSAAKPYVLRNTGGVYSCSCPAWRNQSVPIERRTCKHLRKLRGDEAETARIGTELPTREISKTDPEEPPLLLAQSWDSSTELTGWWLSEKLDGVRAYWDGKNLMSRLGNVFFAPAWFLAELPDTPLDGELWMARKSFQKTVSVVRRQDRSDHWKRIRYRVFDAPSATGPFEDRISALQDFFRSASPEFTQLHEHERCRGLDHLRDELARIESLGGEGLMARQPGSEYVPNRSHTLLKIKTFRDAEALVIGHVAGRGRHKGRMGSVLARLEDGTEFSVGTGFSDAERADPPPPGSTINFRYQELSDAGVPRFPSFVRILHREEQATPKGPALARSKRSPKKTSQVTPKSSAGDKRYLEFVGGKSSKFWEVAVDDTEVTVRYGRLGTNGQSRTKSFATAQKARAHAAKLVQEKTWKGYEEKDRGA